MSIRVLVNEIPRRTLALATETHVLFFKHAQAAPNSDAEASTLSLPGSSSKGESPRCLVEFSEKSTVDLSGYRTLTTAKGTLGLITLNGEVFVCVVTGSTEVANVRPGEAVMRILGVEFYCLNRSDYDQYSGYGAGYRDSSYRPNPYPNHVFSTDEGDNGSDYDSSDATAEHPFSALKKVLSSGTFYYSSDFDLTRRLQDRVDDQSTVDIASLDEGLLWNSYMINPLISFRNRLTQDERDALDHSALLTSVIRGYAGTLTIPMNANPIRLQKSNYPATLSVISRLSSRRAGTRFNSRGVDDNGNVANFVETETIFYSPTGICFSYVQVRGSIPIFWESTSSLIPGQQKIHITRSPEATQLSFDRHFEQLSRTYGAVHIVNLLSATKAGEFELTERYRLHVDHSPFRQHENDGEESGQEETVNDDLLRETEFDFHERARAAGGYDGAKQIKPFLQDSADKFIYFLTQDTQEDVDVVENGRHVKKRMTRPLTVMQQHGVFRVNCLDCLDRTNLVQGIISQMALELFLEHRGEVASSSNLSVFWMRHSSLWADNGDALSKIYAGTGALKSSFTRHGKMSLGGLMADARKSATRLYVNHFEDKGRQNTVDLLLGRLVGQEEVVLVDPVNDWVQDQLKKKADEFESSAKLRVWVGTYNLNGKMMTDASQLVNWLDVRKGEGYEIVVVGFQEIVELSPQQIMNTDPGRRIVWENAVKKCINEYQEEKSSDDYILLRSGQLVGAALMVFVKTSLLSKIRNVEGAIKKTGMSGIAGNKGAVAIRMDVEGSSFCFVTAHLAAGFGNYEERNRDYITIVAGLRFQRDRRIEDHEVVIWAGDFNYRIGLSNEKARQLIDTYKGGRGKRSEADEALGRLYENDQLNIQMVAGQTFPYYREGRIAFLPTYKFDLGRDDYDSSEKMRIPAWTDRILWKLDHSKGTNMTQIEYESVVNVRFSDHRPVFSTFDADIRVIDGNKKLALLEELYAKRSREVKEGIEDDSSGSEEAEDLMGYQSIAPGLPPASSDRRKWWLDGDKPVTSELKAPREGMKLNSKRNGNPWTDGGEDEWVVVEGDTGTAKNVVKVKPEPPAPRKQVTKSSSPMPAEANQSKQLEEMSKTPPKPPAPRNSTPTTPMAGAWPASRSVSTTVQAPSARGVNSPTVPALPSRSPSLASTTSSSSKKPPPPKPIKPSTLTSRPSQVEVPRATPSSAIVEQAPSSSSPSAAVEKPPPLPARSNTSTSFASSGAAGRTSYQARAMQADADDQPEPSPMITMIDNTSSTTPPEDSMERKKSAPLPMVQPRGITRAQPNQATAAVANPPLPPRPSRQNTNSSVMSSGMLGRNTNANIDLLGDYSDEHQLDGKTGEEGGGEWKPLLPKRPT